MYLTLDCADCIVLMTFAFICVTLYMIVRKVIDQIIGVINTKLAAKTFTKIYDEMIDGLAGTGASQTMKKVFSTSLKALATELETETSTDSEE